MMVDWLGNQLLELVARDRYSHANSWEYLYDQDLGSSISLLISASGIAFRDEPHYLHTQLTLDVGFHSQHSLLVVAADLTVGFRH